MLPKVANQVLHHTARAVTSAQAAAAPTLRNVLQQSSTGQASSAGSITTWGTVGSSSYSGAGAGAGGAKYHAGSRFYNGYTVSHPSLARSARPQTSSVALSVAHTC
jgi:hypothetical protein